MHHRRSLLGPARARVNLRNGTPCEGIPFFNERCDLQGDPVTAGPCLSGSMPETGWTVSEILFCFQEAVLRRLDKLSPCTAQKWQNDQERYPAALNHHAGVIAMADVFHFMREHAGKFVGVLGFLQQTVEQIDFAVRQREGVGHR